jgi:tetratricopeptide (TPR) repeat protein
MEFGHALHSTGRFPEAVAGLKILVERKPNLGTAWVLMGLAEIEMKDYRNALLHLQRGEELGYGGSAEGMRLAKYRLGVLLNQNGQFEEAIEVLTPASGPGRLDQEIRTALGMALLRIPSLPPRTPLISRQHALTRLKRLLSTNNPSPPCASAGDLHGIHFSSRLDDSLLSR